MHRTDINRLGMAYGVILQRHASHDWHIQANHPHHVQLIRRQLSNYN